MSQSPGERSADRSDATRVDISWRSTAAAPFIPPPVARIARPAAFMSREIEMVLACRSPAGPARSMSSAYVVEVQVSLLVPWLSHHWARPFPESGRVRSMTCTDARRPERQVGREYASPGDDPAFLFGRVEQHERGMRDADDRGQGRGVRVVDHHRAGLGVDPLPQPGGVARESERPGGPWLHDAPPVDELTACGAPQPSAADGRPLDELAPADPDEGEGDTHEDDRERDDDGADVEPEHQARCGDPGHGELKPGESEEYAAPAQPGELHRRQGRLRGTVR